MSTTTTTRTRHHRANADLATVPRSWIWPLPRLDGIAPCILLSALGRPRSEGIAIGYSGRSSSPSLVPVFATQDGVVTYAANTRVGSTLCIDHLGGWSTSYGELEHLLTRPTDRFRCRRKERVRAGDVIGYAPRSALRIRFGLSRLTDEGAVEQDPSSWMPAWSMLPWFGEPLL